MAGGFLLAFGILSLVIGIAMIAGAYVMRNNNPSQVWTSEMVWLLAFGILFLILGAILIGFGLYYYTRPVAVVEIPLEPVVTKPVVVRQSIVTNPVVSPVVFRQPVATNSVIMNPQIVVRETMPAPVIIRDPEIRVRDPVSDEIMSESTFRQNCAYMAPLELEDAKSNYKIYRDYC